MRNRLYKRHFQYIIKQNYEKAKFIAKRKNGIHYDLILEEQIKLKNSKNEIYVLSTFPLLLFDYNNELVLNLIKNIKV